MFFSFFFPFPLGLSAGLCEVVGVSWAVGPKRGEKLWMISQKAKSKRKKESKETSKGQEKQKTKLVGFFTSFFSFTTDHEDTKEGKKKTKGSKTEREGEGRKEALSQRMKRWCRQRFDGEKEEHASLEGPR